MKYFVCALMIAVSACTTAPAAEQYTCGSPADASAAADVTMTARDAVVTPRQGVSFIAWTYDGDVPGPVLRMAVGETKRIKLINRSPRPLSLHFHGVAFTSGDDGVANASMVNPGCAHVYTVTAALPGVWAYHSHASPRLEMARGLVGAIIVPAPGEAAVDHEYVALIGQLGLEPGAAAGMSEEEAEHSDGAPFFAMTINGRPDGKAPVIEWNAAQSKYEVRPGATASAKVGDRVRWRVLNVSPDDTHTFHLHGHTWCAGGGFRNSQGLCAAGTAATDNLNLESAQGTSFEYVENNPGSWMIHCHVVDHVADGMHAMYEVTE